MLGILKRGARATWNGPFYVGRLTRPVSLGDALLKLLETLWRSALIILGGLAALISAVAIASVSEANSPSPWSVHDLTPSITVNSKECEPAYPILVMIRNNGRRTLNSVQFKLEARRPGRSTDLLEYGAGDRTEDTIIKPGEAAGSCWAMPKTSEDMVEADQRRLTWSVRLQSADWAD